ncbi:MAG: hypothetical protein AAF985_20690 [Bacteroidota bacterium]
MKYAIGFFFGVVLTTLFFSWYIRNQQWSIASEDTSAVIAPSPSSASNDFDTFYEQFHRDSVFQVQHIVFPLEGIPARDSSYVFSDQPFHWEKDSWVIHQSFNDMDGAFSREFMSMGEGLMIENIKHHSGRYGMQRRFAKYDDGWYLIYYAAMNELAVAEATEPQ